MRLKNFAAAMLALSLSAGGALAAKIDIAISKVTQKMIVKVDGETKYVWLVSTGAGKFKTPSGKFRPFRMEAEHFSKEWDDAPMPHSIFFTGQGHAIHGSYHVKRLGTAASHGCIRLAPTNAATLFKLVSKNGMSNTTVEVKGGFGFGFGAALTDDSKPPKKALKKSKRNRLLEKIFN
jgi:lipoprotein-anchoring transpeptidase ErfK/SrfK